jgi:glycosyltransferase involved in cell wall biosynthesis
MSPAGREPLTEAMSRSDTGDRMPLVSVVVPMHNAARHIKTTLICVHAQTYPHLELILVDDGSQDSTPRVVTDCLRASRLPWLLIETPNHGPSKARNIGWRAARGELIQFLDDDDEMDPDKVRHQVDWITSRRSDAAAVYSTWAIRTAANPAVVLVRRPSAADLQIHSIIRADSFMPWHSGLVQRRWLEAVEGFNEQLWLIEDVDLQIRVLAAGGKFEVAESGKPLFFYDQRPRSLSQSDPSAFADACVRNARLVYSIGMKRAHLAPDLIDAVAEAYRGAISTYAQSDRSRFEATYREFRTLFPRAALQGKGKIRYCVPLMGERRAELLRGAVRRVRRRARDMMLSLGRA